MKSYIDRNGDFITEYIVELGRPNDTKSRLIREVDAKCDYMAVEIAERTTPGYIAFHVYPA